MNQENQIGKNLSLIVFAGRVLLCAAAYILYVYLQGQGYAIGDDRFIRNFGEWLGLAGLSLLVLVYARTAFKLLVRKDSFWKRLKPFNIDYARIKTVSGKILFYLNKSHPYFGVSAIALVYLHCYFISRFYNLLPLRLVLALLVWQGFCGLVLKTRIAPAFLKKRGHLFHSQLITGALILKSLPASAILCWGGSNRADRRVGSLSAESALSPSDGSSSGTAFPVSVSHKK